MRLCSEALQCLSGTVTIHQLFPTHREHRLDFPRFGVRDVECCATFVRPARVRGAALCGLRALRVRPSSRVLLSSARRRVGALPLSAAMATVASNVQSTAVRTAPAAGGRRANNSQSRLANASKGSRASAARVQSGRPQQQRSVAVAAVAEGLEPGMQGLPPLEGPTAVSKIVEVAPSWQQLRLDHLTALSSTMGTGQAKKPEDLKARCLAMSQLSDGTTWEVCDPRKNARLRSDRTWADSLQLVREKPPHGTCQLRHVVLR